MLQRLQNLKTKIDNAYEEALNNNLNNIDDEVTILHELKLIIDTLLMVGPYERQTKLKKLVPKIREGLTIKEENDQ